MNTEMEQHKELETMMLKDAKIVSLMEALKKNKWRIKLCETIEASKQEQIWKILWNRWEDFDKKFSVNDLYKENILTYEFIMELPDRISAHHANNI